MVFRRQVCCRKRAKGKNAPKRQGENPLRKKKIRTMTVNGYEDSNRTRRGNGQENLGKLRRLVQGMLLKVKGKQTVPKMMFQAALSPEFRTTVVEQIVKNES